MRIKVNKNVDTLYYEAFAMKKLFFATLLLISVVSLHGSESSSKQMVPLKGVVNKIGEDKDSLAEAFDFPSEKNFERGVIQGWADYFVKGTSGSVKKELDSGTFSRKTTGEEGATLETVLLENIKKHICHVTVAKLELKNSRDRFDKVLNERLGKAEAFIKALQEKDLKINSHENISNFYRALKANMMADYHEQSEKEELFLKRIKEIQSGIISVSAKEPTRSSSPVDTYNSSSTIKRRSELFYLSREKLRNPEITEKD